MELGTIFLRCVHFMYQNLSLTYGMSGWSIMQHNFTADNIVCSTKILVHVSLTSREWVSTRDGRFENRNHKAKSFSLKSSSCWDNRWSNTLFELAVMYKISVHDNWFPQDSWFVSLVHCVPLWICDTYVMELFTSPYPLGRRTRGWVSRAGPHS